MRARPEGDRHLWIAIITATLTVGCTVMQHGGAARSPDPVARQDQQEDIAAFRSEFLAVDRAYSPSASREAEHRVAALERAAGNTSSAAFLVELCRIAALADNGHSGCRISDVGVSVGIGFSPIDEGFSVLQAAPENIDLLGAQLLAIDGQSVEQIRPVIRSMAGGVPAHRDLLVAPVLARPDLLRALRLARAADAATYRLRTLDGRIVERHLAIGPHSANWVRLQSAQPAWASRDVDEPFRWRDAPELDAVVVQLRQNADRGDRKIAAFLEDAEDARERLGRKNVVLDMRWNGGGDFSLTRDFMAAWPERVPRPGRFFVLIGPVTFSAGIASVAYLKQAGQDRITLIGEPVGDHLMFFAEGSPFRLPHSRIVMSPATQRDDFKDGCRHYDDCVLDLAQPGAATGTPPKKAAQLEALGRKPVQIDSLDPEVRAPWTIQDYLAGRDPGIDAVQAMETKSNRE
jgi:hypothetical protein